ncbi:hypothetical protein GCM10009539_03830 [Cryptosporangium japonicum]|uniref:Uncharacterized protein n=1 Tax=Cryptosporangium japonicum TaxID=80872 RepID=A0ABN0THJ9_9ACTN
MVFGGAADSDGGGLAILGVGVFDLGAAGLLGAAADLRAAAAVEVVGSDVDEVSGPGK